MERGDDNNGDVTGDKDSETMTVMTTMTMPVTKSWRRSMKRIIGNVAETKNTRIPLDHNLRSV